MTLNMIQSLAESSKVKLSIESDRIVIEGPSGQVDELTSLVRQWKPELLKILKGETITNVGQCDCGASLIGLPTTDGFVNRACPECGRWHRCICDPCHAWTELELLELWDERSAIVEHDGKVNAEQAKILALRWLKEEIGETQFHKLSCIARSSQIAFLDFPEKSTQEIPKFEWHQPNDIRLKWLPSAGTPDSPSTQL